ncbi:MAG TPA: GNAT family N-acetyltransferase [Candidatus Limnocylindrales bacterium]|nr:GNAT family N-acetyltransferase [Candidatus Limnocylindrales bacterium]
MSNTVVEESFDRLFEYWASPGSSLNWPSVFVIPAWLKVWWDSFGAGNELSLYSIWSDQVLIGIAPLMRRGSTACFIGSVDVCDYLDFAAAPNKEKEFMQALLPYLKEKGIKRLELQALRPESVFLSAMAAAPETSAYQLQTQLDGVSFELVLPDSWEGYLSVLDKKQRHEVRRKLRRLQDETGSFHYRVIEENTAMQEFFPVFLGLFRQNPEKVAFMTAAMEIFFQSVITELTALNLCRFGVLEVDGVIAAAVLYFDYQGRIYLYNSGYLPQYSSLSAGLLCKVFCIEDSIAKKRHTFDFLKGAEIYKNRLGGKELLIYNSELTY